jgi:flagellar biosynthetic protein FliR
MTIEHNILGAVFIFARIAAAVWTAPGGGSSAFGTRFRLIASVLLAVAVAPIVAPIETSLVSAGDWFWAITGELGVGGASGFSASLIVAAGRQAGDMIASAAGLGHAMLIDAEPGEEATAIGRLYGLLATAMFAALDGPMRLVRMIVASYRVVPVGRLRPTTHAADWAFDRLDLALETALTAAFPALVSLLIAGFAIALIGRAAPSLALWSMSLPMRIVVGLIVVAASVGIVAAAAGASWNGLAEKIALERLLS